MGVILCSTCMFETSRAPRPLEMSRTIFCVGKDFAAHVSANRGTKERVIIFKTVYERDIIVLIRPHIQVTAVVCGVNRIIIMMIITFSESF